MVQKAKRKTAQSKDRAAQAGQTGARRAPAGRAGAGLAGADQAEAEEGELVHGYSERDRRDCVMTASIDSFPASDPPGWISCGACPHGDDAASNMETAKAARKKQRP